MSPLKSVEAIIQEAMQRGEFDHLANQGRPLNLDDYFNTPEDMRLAYSVLKNAGILPAGVELSNRMAALKAELETCSDPARQKELRRALLDCQLKYNVLREKR